jgi:uridylate kinase
MEDDHPCYKRILLKISGEALKGDEDSCFSKTVITDITREIKQVHELGVEIAVVIGGGNLFRGDRSNNLGLDRATADYMGMLATIINGIALGDLLGKTGLETRLVSALEIKAVAESYMRPAVLRHLENKRVVIFAAGTGSPFFTTDTAAALRAIEIRAGIFLKATMVDGAYSDDPKKNKNSIKFDRLSYAEVLDKKLKVLDSTAVTLCQENHLPIKIFNITKKGNLVKAITDEHLGTIIC